MTTTLRNLIASLNERDGDTLAIALEVRADAFKTALESNTLSKAPADAVIREAWAYREALCRDWARALRAVEG